MELLPIIRICLTSKNETYTITHFNLVRMNLVSPEARCRYGIN